MRKGKTMVKKEIGNLRRAAGMMKLRSYESSHLWKMRPLGATTIG